MNERDSLPDASDGQRPADPATAPQPAVPSAFGSAPAFSSEPAPVTGAQPMAAVPSRRSLRGKPPVSTAAIPVVPAPSATTGGPQPAGAPQAAAASDTRAPMGSDAATSAAAPSTPAGSPDPARAADVTPQLSGTALPRRSSWKRDGAAPGTAAPTPDAMNPAAANSVAPAPTDPATAAPAAAPIGTQGDAAGYAALGAIGAHATLQPTGPSASGSRPTPPASSAPTPAAPNPSAAAPNPTAATPNPTAATPNPPAAAPNPAAPSAPFAPTDPTAPTAPPAWHPVSAADTAASTGPQTPWKPVTGAQAIVPPRDTTPPSTPESAPDVTPAAVENSGAPVPVPDAHSQVPAEAHAAPTHAAPGWDPSAQSPPTTATPAVAGFGAHSSEEPVTSNRRSRRGLWITLIVVGVVVLAGAGVAAWFLLNRDEPAAQQQEVVQAPVPTSALTPVDRAATSAFAANLPGTVLQYALTGSQQDTEWSTVGALESYLDSYADEAGDQMTVHSGQWASADQARAQQESMAGALTGEVLSSGPVTVDGQDTGAVTVVDLGDGNGAALWSNGTGVFVLTAPVDDVTNAYAAYPV
ncbi:hypothetical protein [Cellulomonas taurus]|uniref:hypothetical protein n=1 Tax=Cellulomonas taurus TaxID=2729175 RepID=UPI00145D11C2|nr:hypothetical protein [Cellulomonas taurus]